ncbi:uncharacterized protein LOC110447596 [Mizuhopecten yessoensis]|uniref:Actin-fragmin kinase n=1 Tax=Mizuhopecten yessoensis TaxID=6573 RepID=A0A210QV67_MIZYE|nr:uncharacterized protein LOC110447596 [Mizuhopecten yessoensis]OWF52572.1 Actin-fragmin kinase [Mizuhopecten yessoensis]
MKLKRDMSVIFLVGSFLLLLPFSESKDVRWKWQAGSSSVNQVATDLGLGARSGGMVLKDYNTYNNLYLFGGLVYDPKLNKQRLTNDLWFINGGVPSENILHKGNSGQGVKRGTDQLPAPRMLGAGCGIPGAMFMVYGGYGEQDVLADTWIYDFRLKNWSSFEKMHSDMKENDTDLLSPPARADMAVWCLRDKLVIFGGIGVKAQIFRDMWEFDFRTLTWREMENSVLMRNQIYNNHLTLWPEPRNGATTWVKDTALYLFGGNRAPNYNINYHHNTGFGSDLFMYNITEGTWRYVHGRRQTGQAGKFAFVGQHTRDNEPGCRRGGAGIVDTSGNLWLFGGEGADVQTNSISSVKPPKRLADLWHFDVLKNQWAFKAGFESGNSAGIYNGDKNTYYTGSQPGSRFDTMAVVAGNTILVFGGTGMDAGGKEGLLSDFWEIDMHNYVAYFSATYSGTIFNLIFWPFTLVAIICVSFLYGRKFFDKPGTKRDIAYAPLTQE